MTPNDILHSSGEGGGGRWGVQARWGLGTQHSRSNDHSRVGNMKVLQCHIRTPRLTHLRAQHTRTNARTPRHRAIGTAEPVTALLKDCGVTAAKRPQTLVGATRATTQHPMGRRTHHFVVEVHTSVVVRCVEFSTQVMLVTVDRALDPVMSPARDDQQVRQGCLTGRNQGTWTDGRRAGVTTQQQHSVVARTAPSIQHPRPRVWCLKRKA